MSTTFLRLQKRFARLGIQIQYSNQTYYLQKNQCQAQILLPENLPLEEKAVLQLLDFANVKIPEHTAHVCAAKATPDFHPGNPVPVGSIVATTDNMVIPAAIGTDINCGMRLINTHMVIDEVLPHIEALKTALKAVLLEDKRDIPMNKTAFTALFDQGLTACLNTLPNQGLWQHMDKQRALAELDCILHQSSIHASSQYAPEAFFQDRDILRPASLGTVGSGNHFVELQVVDSILDRHAAYQAGFKKGQVVAMIHTGSRDVGFYVGKRWQDKAKAMWPNQEKFPESGLFALVDDAARDYLLAMGAAARYAWLNRIAITELFRQAWQNTLGQDHSQVLVDVSHNMVFTENGFNIHRKGATPAHKNQLALIPGSMGDYSFVAMGLGNPEWLSSCSHGAGRAVKRQAMRRHVSPQNTENALPFECITLKKDRLIEESPQAYKPITPVIKVQEEAGLIAPIVKLKPWITFKA